MRRTVLISLLTAFALPALAATLSVDPGKVLGPISPYIYGTNQDPASDSGITVRRMGGNRQTPYNWENNASNAGSDWKHSSDQWPCTDVMKLKDCDQPGAMALHFVERDKAAGFESLLTVPMVDYVTADKLGEVAEADKAPSARWVKNLASRPGGPQATVDPNDGAVYQDEFVSFLLRSFGPADKGGVRFYDLDNEPALWSSTHPRIHPDKPTYEEMVKRGVDYASMITQLDPGAVVLGPVAYGWQEFRSLQEAPGFKELNAQWDSFTDYYLDGMAKAEKTAGRRLLHALDMHWYPEAQGAGKRVTEDDSSPEVVEARLQAPRSLWDDTYVETSWITQYSTQGKPIRLLRWFKETIAKRYPGTKLALTEYNYGAGAHISGGLALADVLGIYGREGVYLACLWADWKPYTASAFKLYRNYDGKGGAFGDTAVEVGNPDVAGMSVFAATDSKRPGKVSGMSKLWVVMINKSQKDSKGGTLALKGVNAGTWMAYGFDSKGPELKAKGQGKFRKGALNYLLAPLSATVFEITMWSGTLSELSN